MRAKFTKEHLEFVRKEYLGRTRIEITKLFNDHFDAELTISQMSSFVKNNKIKSGLTGRFFKGQKSWSAGTKGILKANSGSFKKGNKPHNITKLGTERICSKDGYVLVKVNEQNPYTKHKTRYKHKHIFLWESAHGKIPRGMILRFKDGDKMNVVIDNLEIVSKALHLRLNKNELNAAPGEIKPTIRAVSELEVKMFDRMT